ncbi:MAG: Sec-dependent nitrous-oxide reductase [Phycisphaeraceae bacterium]|nr:Sec-dependent nitrous-oxide reductase [Phycisphaerales bacterium]QOJ17642.1 MAG: Sec-dependent nitrous-oxide reductase [Phycisphaeraceae bacterium]
MKKHLAILAAGGLVLTGCGGGESGSSPDIRQVDTARKTSGGAASAGGLSGDAAAIAKARDLTPDDITAALKTYMPSGRIDDYLLFASGGHSGQVLVYGVPSMRLLRVIAVFTPEPWQGWGYGVGNEILDQGNARNNEIRWADTHHPSISETNGEFDGQWLFIGDKANARVAVIDLRDFETKQIVKNPIAINDHGGTFVTPNTEYIIEGGQYGTPLGWDYAPLEDYQKSYRGNVTMWKFDRAKGRIDVDQSFALELPPYWQDLFDAGKGVSDGWIFGNSINTELATGSATVNDKNYFEAGASQNETDYLHIINWKKAEQVFKAGKATKVKGFNVLSLQTCIDEGILFFAPELKSPHGVDITPGGEYIVVSGKLDPHVTVYSFDKIQKAIAAGKFDRDVYGVPILKLEDVVEAQVELGLGPLHTQFDDKGYAYTSLFLDSAIARWTLGGPYAGKNPDKPWSLVAKVPVQYNVGHLGAAEGDTVSPDGKYLVAFNKWSIDRFFPTGPLLPQNFQLIDISQTGDKMQVIYDAPVGLGEPHYSQMIRADKLKTWEVYPEIGWNPHTQSVDPNAPMPGKERIVRNGSTVEIYMTAVRSHFKPERVEVNLGDHVIWRITNVERTKDATHGFAIPGYNITASLEPGETVTIEFEATQAGAFPFYCSEFCSALHLEMLGYFLVKPQ